MLAPLPECERFVERRLAVLEALDDLLELLLGVLEVRSLCHRVSSTWAPKPPSANWTSTRRPGATSDDERTIASSARTIA